jgi:hypothetical protein
MKEAIKRKYNAWSEGLKVRTEGKKRNVKN